MLSVQGRTVKGPELWKCVQISINEQVFLESMLTLNINQILQVSNCCISLHSFSGATHYCKILIVIPAPSYPGRYMGKMSLYFAKLNNKASAYNIDYRKLCVKTLQNKALKLGLLRCTNIICMHTPYTCKIHNCILHYCYSLVFW